MRSGHVDAMSRTQVSGWAADSDRPDTALEVCLLVNGEEAGRALAQRMRGDLAALGKYGRGHHGFSFTFPEALQGDRDHMISVRFAEDMRPLPAGERTIPRDHAATPVMTAELEAPASAPAEAGPDPILVTAPGRSGTTYLMSCLAASPKIIVAELVPYEVRLLSYYAAAFGVLTAPADQERSTHPDRLEGDGFHIGFNPFSGAQYVQAFRGKEALASYHADWAPTRLGTAMADIVREYYRRLAVDRGKRAVPFFAEKNNNLHKPTRVFVRRAFPRMREVVIVRDPRDVLCSHMAYFSSSQDKAFGHLTHSSGLLIAIDEAKDESLCIIRYEDMIRGNPTTFDRLSSFLHAPVAPVEKLAGSRMFQKHGTSSTPQASMGRWRRDLPEVLREKSNREWSTFLKRFGYDAN